MVFFFFFPKRDRKDFKRKSKVESQNSKETFGKETKLRKRKLRKENTRRKEQESTQKANMSPRGLLKAEPLLACGCLPDGEGQTVPTPACARYTVTEKKWNTVSETHIIFWSKTYRQKFILNWTCTFSSKSFICRFWMSVLSSKSRILWKEKNPKELVSIKLTRRSFTNLKHKTCYENIISPCSWKHHKYVFPYPGDCLEV